MAPSAALTRHAEAEAPPRTVEAPDGLALVADLALVDRALAGDDQAFARILERHWERIFRLVQGIVGDWHRSEDVVQEVFVLVHRNLGRFDRRSSLLTWIYRIAVNAALKSRRRARRRLLLPLGEGEEDRQAAGPVLGHDLELRELGQKLLKCLPNPMRAIVVLREWEGLSYEEIAKVLGISRGAVEQRLHRAMVMLRKVWKPAAREEWLHGL